MTDTEAARRLAKAWIDNSPVNVSGLTDTILQLADALDAAEARVAHLVWMFDIEGLPVPEEYRAQSASAAKEGKING